MSSIQNRFQIAYCVSVVLGYPMSIYPCFAILEDQVMGGTFLTFFPNMSMSRIFRSDFLSCFDSSSTGIASVLGEIFGDTVSYARRSPSPGSSVFSYSGKGVSTTVRNIGRSCVTITGVFFALWGGQDIDLFVSFVGTFCCAPLLFVFPPYVFIFPVFVEIHRGVESLYFVVGA